MEPSLGSPRERCGRVKEIRSSTMAEDWHGKSTKPVSLSTHAEIGRSQKNVKRRKGLLEKSPVQRYNKGGAARKGEVRNGGRTFVREARGENSTLYHYPSILILIYQRKESKRKPKNSIPKKERI